MLLSFLYEPKLEHGCCWISTAYKQTSIKYRDLVAETSTIPNAINWAKLHGLLHKEESVLCQTAEGICVVARHDVSVGLQWRCTYGKRVGYRIGTFSEQSHFYRFLKLLIFCITGQSFEELTCMHVNCRSAC